VTGTKSNSFREQDSPDVEFTLQKVGWFVSVFEGEDNAR
jgi:hypothetical protein